jgi:hypothetical protein
MLFVYLDHHYRRLDLRERRFAYKASFLAPLGLGRLFCYLLGPRMRNVYGRKPSENI